MLLLLQNRLFRRAMPLLASLSLAVGIAARAEDQPEKDDDNKQAAPVQGDRIYSALILASNSATPKKPDRDLAGIGANVQRVFGYNQIEVIGSETQVVDEKCEAWLVPSRNFWMSVKAKQEGKDKYKMAVELYHDKRQLVHTDVKISSENTLLIRGPMHARGQLLIVLRVLQ